MNLARSQERFKTKKTTYYFSSDAQFLLHDVNHAEQTDRTAEAEVEDLATAARLIEQRRQRAVNDVADVREVSLQRLIVTTTNHSTADM